MERNGRGLIAKGSQSKQTTAPWPNREGFCPGIHSQMATWLGCEAADLREEEAQACTRQQTAEHTLRRTTQRNSDTARQ